MEYKELESERLLLVYPDQCYASETLKYLNKRVTTYMNPKAQETMDECLAFLDFAKKAIEKGTDYNYIILDKNTKEFYGCCGVGLLKEKEPELGIWIKETAHHKGYGKEAVTCMYEYLSEYGDYESFQYPVDHRNISSRKIPESLHATCNGKIQCTINGNGDTLELITYHIPRKNHTHTLLDIVKLNRSYRGYDETRRITKEELLDMVNHARLSASSVNAQPLCYALAYEKDLVDRIQPHTKWAKALSLELPHAGKCPTAFIIVCQDTRISSNTDAYLRDVGIVSQTILLRAAEMGLGGCMIGNYNKADIKKEVGLQEYLYPHLILAIGKPAEVVLLCDADDDVHYYRDEEDRHYVPKRSLEDITIDL